MKVKRVVFKKLRAKEISLKLIQ